MAQKKKVKPYRVRTDSQLRAILYGKETTRNQQWRAIDVLARRLLLSRAEEGKLRALARRIKADRSSKQAKGSSGVWAYTKSTRPRVNGTPGSRVRRR